MENTIKVRHKLGDSVAIILGNGDIVNGMVSKIEYSEEINMQGKSCGVNEQYKVRTFVRGSCESLARSTNNIYASREDAARAYLAKQQIKI